MTDREVWEIAKRLFAAQSLNQYLAAALDLPQGTSWVDLARLEAEFGSNKEITRSAKLGGICR